MAGGSINYDYIQRVIRNQEPRVSLTSDTDGFFQFIGFDEFVLATQKRIELPVFQGGVKIPQRLIKVEIIPGDELIGMKLLAKIGSKLIINFDRAAVKLIR